MLMVASLLGALSSAIDATAASATSVTEPSVALSTEAATATDVTYTVGLTTSTTTGAIPAGGTISLVAPQGTLWPGSGNYAITDSTTPTGSGSGQSVTTVDNGAAVTLGVPHAIDAGDALSIVITGVVNPGAGTGAITISTSNDETPVSTPAYTITSATSATSVTEPSVALSTEAATATDVTYTVGLTTSTTTGAIPAGGTISLVAPQGTLWPGSGNYAITDSTTPTGSGSGQSVTTVDNGAAVTLGVPHAIDAGDALSIVITGVVNPGAGTGAITISTSNDETPVSTPAYTITSATSATSVTEPSVALSTEAATATDVTYTVGLTTSTTTGAIPAGGTISLVAPQGTLWPGSGNYAITDSTTPTGSGSGQSVTTVDNGAAVTLGVPHAIDAGDALSIVITGVVNPGAGTGAITISTSNDETPVSTPAYTITSATSVTEPSVALSTEAATATDVTYTVGLTTSTTTGAIPAGGTISLVAPQGTLRPGSGNYAITDSTTPTGSGSGQSVTTVDNGAAVTLGVPHAIDAGDALSIVITGVVNPEAGTGAITISTSNDETPVSTPAYTITGATTAQSSVTPGALALTSTAARATAVTYSVSFTTSATGGIAPGGSVTLIAPTGTLFPGSCSGYCSAANSITDTTNGAGTSGSPIFTTTDNGSMITLYTRYGINAGDSVTVTVSGVTNPATTGSLTVGVLTSADTGAVQVADPITTAQSSVTPGALAADLDGRPGDGGHLLGELHHLRHRWHRTRRLGHPDRPDGDPLPGQLQRLLLGSQLHHRHHQRSGDERVTDLHHHRQRIDDHPLHPVRDQCRGTRSPSR